MGLISKQGEVSFLEEEDRVKEGINNNGCLWDIENVVDQSGRYDK